MNLVKQFKKEYSWLSSLINVSLVYISLYILLYDKPILIKTWNVEFVNTILNTIQNFSIGIVISGLFFVITVFYPQYQERIKYLEVHINILKKIRGRIYTALAPVGRYFELVTEGSEIVYVEKSSLYDLKLIVEKINYALDKRSDIQYAISNFIMDKEHPMKFTDSVNESIRNVDYMYRMLDNLKLESDRAIVLMRNNRLFSDIAHTLITIQDNYFILSINPNTETRRNIYIDYFPELVKQIEKLNEIIDDLENENND